MMFALVLVLGLFVSIIGIIIPGMLNMTIAKISVKENQQQALNFAFGAVVVVFFSSFFGHIFCQIFRRSSFF